MHASKHYLGLVCGLLLPLLFAPWADAYAHVRSESFSHWQYAGRTLDLRFTVSAREATRIPAKDRSESLESLLMRYLGTHIAVGPPEAGCVPARAMHPLAARPGYLQIEAAWRCEKPPASLGIHTFFDLAAEHTHFARYESPQGVLQRLITEENQNWDLAGPDNGDQARRARGSSFTDYVWLGARHILSGYDHIAFLLALLLICRGTREIVWAISGFTLGHSISLSLAVLGMVEVDVTAIEATIGLTIALVAVERTALVLRSALPLAACCAALLLMIIPFAVHHGAGFEARTLAGLALFSFCYLLIAHDLHGRGGYRILVTALFGLVHGFGFAGAFLASNAGVEVRPSSLAGFNIGVELGQLALVAVMISLGSAFKRSSRLAVPAADLLSAVVCAFGVFWFVQRSLP